MQAIMAKKLEGDFMNIDPKEIFIRMAELSDIPAITEIYNYEVENGVATFDTEIKTIENRIDWFKQHDTRNPVFVAIVNQEVTGWAAFSKWSERSAYDTTAEVSIYMNHKQRGIGIGSILFKHLINSAQNLGLHCLVSRITDGNETSIRIHELNGFTKIGVMHEVGHKFGNYLNVTLMEKIID